MAENPFNLEIVLNRMGEATWMHFQLNSTCNVMHYFYQSLSSHCKHLLVIHVFCVLLSDWVSWHVYWALHISISQWHFVGVLHSHSIICGKYKLERKNTCSIGKWECKAVLGLLRAMWQSNWSKKNRHFYYTEGWQSVRISI